MSGAGLPGGFDKSLDLKCIANRRRLGCKCTRLLARWLPHCGTIRKAPARIWPFPIQIAIVLEHLLALYKKNSCNLVLFILSSSRALFTFYLLNNTLLETNRLFTHQCLLIEMNLPFIHQKIKTKMTMNGRPTVRLNNTQDSSLRVCFSSFSISPIPLLVCFNLTVALYINCIPPSVILITILIQLPSGSHTGSSTLVGNRLGSITITFNPCAIRSSPFKSIMRITIDLCKS
jgi:hypothetical protein